MCIPKHGNIDERGFDPDIASAEARFKGREPSRHPQLLTFKPFVTRKRMGFFLGYAMIIVPKGGWFPREIFASRGKCSDLCTELKDGSLIMNVSVSLYDDREVIHFFPPSGIITSKDHVDRGSYQDLVKISPEMRDEIIVLLHREVL